MLTPAFNQTRQFQCQYPIIKGIMGLWEPAFGFQLTYDLHRDLRPFAVLQLMDTIVQHLQQALPCLRRRVGARRATFTVRFLTPPSEPAVQVFPATGSPEIGLSPPGLPLGLSSRSRSQPAPFGSSQTFMGLLPLLGIWERQSPAALRPVAGFPSLRLL
jgi:hypothetical protein